MSPKSVLVCDFVGPDDRLTELGAKLADDLSRALRATGGPVAVDRSKSVDDLRGSQTDRQLNGCQVAANRLSTPYYISGEISTRGDRVALSLDLFMLMPGWDIVVDNMKIEMPFDATAKSLLAADIPGAPRGPYPPAASAPQCDFCPKAVYPEAASVDNVQGKVLLLAVIGSDGKVSGLSVLAGLTDTLNQAAVDAVRRWTFKPAMDKNHNAIAVRQRIEVGFYLY